MNFNYTINLTPEQVEKILKEYLSKQIKGTISGIKLTVARRSVGYGMSESQEPYFAGAKIEVDGESE